MAKSGWTPEKFSEDYPLPVRIRLTRIRVGSSAVRSAGRRP